jgi:type IV secretory pathway VirB10-like protein
MSSRTRLRPSAKRSYLWIGVTALLVLIGIILLWRGITGSTIKERRALAMSAKAAEELQALPPANPETLSAKLEAQRQEAEKLRQESAARDGPPTPALPSSASGSETSIRPSGSPSSEPPPVGVRPRAANPGVDIEGLFPSEEALSDYERRKAQAAQAEKLSAPPNSSLLLPGSSRSGQPGAPSNLTLLPDLSVGQGGSAQAPAATVSPALAAQLASLLQAQQSGARSQPTSVAPQERFREQLTAQQAQPALRLQPAVGPARQLIMEGTSVPVVMEVDVSSDIRGRCTARVAQDVLDSITLSQVLVPAGSRLICTYDDQVVQGQNKLLLAFTRLILPNGSSVPIADMDAADRFGAIGAPAQVNSRFWSIFGSSFLIAAVTRLAEPNQPAAGAVTINTAGAGSSGSTAAGVLAETSKRVLERNLNVKPELRLSAGDYLRLTVTRDMLIEPFSPSSTHTSQRR